MKRILIKKKENTVQLLEEELRMEREKVSKLKKIVYDLYHKNPTFISEEDYNKYLK